MSETVTVIEAKNPKPWQHGITYYDMIFDRNGQRFGCSWGTKGGEPQVGETVTGEFSQDDSGQWKFRKGSKDGAPSQFSHGSSTETSTSNNSKSASKGDVDWDARNAEIRRQHSQEMAIRWMALPGSSPHKSVDEDEASLNHWADWFDQDAIAAGQKASQGAAGKADVAPFSAAQSPGTAAPEQPPVDFSGARTEEPSPSMPDDSHQWLESLLVVAGAGYEARELALYAVNKLRPDQLKTLESELNDPETERKIAGLKRIEASYEKAEGHPVPKSDPGDDLPF